MPRIHKLLCASTLALGFVSRSYCQAESCQHRILPLSVYDSEGRTVTDLKPSDFEGKYRGQPVKILSIVPDDRPHRVIILLDASGSMQDMWGLGVAVASEGAETQSPNTQVALIIFAEKINEFIDFSRGRSVVAERLREIRSDPAYLRKSVQGRTALYDSLLSGLNALGNATSADSLLLVSDAEADHFSRAHFDEVAHKLTSSGVRLFLVGLFHRLGSRYRTPEELKEPISIVQLVKNTGGGMVAPSVSAAPYGQNTWSNSKEVERVTSAMKDFCSGITKDDLLEFELPEPVDKRRSWELRFSPEKKKQFKGAEISYPLELAPCQY